MAWGGAAVSSWETDALALDRPCLISMNAGAHSTTSTSLPRWSSDTGVVADTDRSETGYEARFGVDYSAHRRTRPTGSDNEWWYVLECNTTGLSFDSIALIDHNLASISSCQVRVDIADSADFATNYVLVTSITPNAGRHLVLLGTRYTGGGYLRLRIWNNGGANFIPEIGEVWFGRRRQLTGDVLSGDVSAYTSGVRWSGDGSAASVGFSEYEGALNLDLDLLVRDRSGSSVLRDTSTLNSFWSEIEYGQKPFLWCRAPSSANNTFNIMRTPDEALALSVAGPVQRGFHLTAREMPVYLSAGS